MNVTVPQRECDTREEAEVEMKCKVVKEMKVTPVCLTVVDKAVEETCEEAEVAEECYAPMCSNITIPLLSKQCREETEERCEVIIETMNEDQCKEVDSTEYEEECTTTEEEECNTTQVAKDKICLLTPLLHSSPQEYVCEEVAAVKPADGYGVPQVL